MEKKKLKVKNKCWNNKRFEENRKEKCIEIAVNYPCWFSIFSLYLNICQNINCGSFHDMNENEKGLENQNISLQFQESKKMRRGKFSNVLYNEKSEQSIN